MNAEAQKLMDTINRLMQKGMSRDDDTIKTLESLIKEELDKGETDDAFLQRPNRPEVGRPNMAPDPKFATPQDFEQARPNWRDQDRETDMNEQAAETNARDRERMLRDYMRGPQENPLTQGFSEYRDMLEEEDMLENYARAPEGFEYAPTRDPAHKPAGMQNFILPPQYGFKNIEAGLDYEFNPTQDMSRQRQTFARPGTQAAIHERNMRTFPPPLPRTAQDGFTLGNMERPSFQRPSAGPSTEEELEMIMKDAEDEPVYEDEYE